jgi:hypothetical protein
VVSAVVDVCPIRRRRGRKGTTRRPNCSAPSLAAQVREEFDRRLVTVHEQLP